MTVTSVSTHDLKKYLAIFVLNSFELILQFFFGSGALPGLILYLGLFFFLFLVPTWGTILIPFLTQPGLK